MSPVFAPLFIPSDLIVMFTYLIVIGLALIMGPCGKRI
jgi:hypothetical protein